LRRPAIAIPRAKKTYFYVSSFKGNNKINK
jgi:hypothetical protein